MSEDSGPLGSTGTEVVVLDGGLATELEAAGHDLTGDLWSARLLVEDPAAITAVHRTYFGAGAQVATTVSYQASYEGLAAAGIDRAAANRLFARSVALARVAADEEQSTGARRWVAASIGPYGAMLAEGQEYTGDYGPDSSVTALRRWHRPRLETLAAAEPDLLALETVPCLAEVEALLLEVADLGVPAWLSLSCLGDRTRRGEPASEAFAMAADVPSIIAVGVNCTDPRDVASLVASATAASSKPGIAYPNSGEIWDGKRRCWTGRPDFDPVLVQAWVDAGARLVGGCCRVGPREIARLAAQRRTGARIRSLQPGARHE